MDPELLPYRESADRRGWSGNWSQSGENITVTNASFNGSLSTGTTINIGSNFSYSGTNVAPTVFTLNGTQCNGAGGGGGNTVTVTSPGNQTGTVGTAASLQIQASDSGSGQTLSYTATGLPAGLSISSSTGLITGTPDSGWHVLGDLTAKDGTGATGSATFTWTISTGGSGGGSILIDPSSFSVSQGGSDVFGVSLAAAPSGNITVNVARTAGNSGLSVSAGGSLTLPLATGCSLSR